MNIPAIGSAAAAVATHTSCFAAITRISSLVIGSSSCRARRIPSSMYRGAITCRMCAGNKCRNLFANIIGVYARVASTTSAISLKALNMVSTPSPLCGRYISSFRTYADEDCLNLFLISSMKSYRSGGSRTLGRSGSSLAPGSMGLELSHHQRHLLYRFQSLLAAISCARS